ncbi:hypothetical protein QBC42DRAFT_329959, partial [Cladorrhinum samala]
YCPSCGHAICGRCRRDNPAVNSGSNQPAVPGEVVAAGSRQISAVSADEMASVSAAVATAGSATPIPVSSSVQENSPVKSTSPENQKQGDLANVGKRHSVKQSPFIIADQAAKVKPQVTTIHVLATPPSKPPKYDITPDIGPQPRQSAPSSHHHHQLLATPPSSEPSLLPLSTNASSSSSSSSSYSSSASRVSVLPSPARSSVVEPSSTRVHQGGKSSDRSPEPSAKLLAVNPQQPQTSPVLRRVQVMAQQKAHEGDASSPRKMQQVLRVDVDSSGGVTAQGRGRGIPRVRVTSPPAWLKGAGVFASPGTRERREQEARSVRRVWEDKLAGGIDAVLGGDISGGSEKAGRGVSGSGDSGGSSAATTLGVGKVNNPDVGSGSERSPRGRTPPIAVKGSGDSPTRSINAQHAQQSPRKSQGHQSLARYQSQAHRSSEPSDSQPTPAFWKLPSQSALAGGRETVARAMKNRKGSDTTVSTTVTEEHAVIGDIDKVMDDEEEEGGEEEDDVGIQGLTIVLHLKGKDDLVISTDLTTAGSGGSVAGLGLGTGSTSVRGGVLVQDGLENE